MRYMDTLMWIAIVVVCGAVVWLAIEGVIDFVKELTGTKKPPKKHWRNPLEEN